VRLAAAVKAGNPDAGLLCAGVQVEQELVEDGFKALLVLAVADKGFQLVAQDAWAASEWSSETSATPLLARRFSLGALL
jgi:hypothetical protein